MSTKLKDIIHLMDKYLIADDFKVSCIYFLLSGKQIVYIGQSKNFVRRILSHKNKMQFDSFRIIPCEEDKLDFYERRLVFFFKPKLNIYLVNRKKIKGLKTDANMVFNILAVFKEMRCFNKNIAYNDIRLAINGEYSGLDKKNKEHLLYIINQGSQEAIERVFQS